MGKGLKSLKRKTLKKIKNKGKSKKRSCKFKCRLYKDRIFRMYK
jgi:hypothetical protein